MTFNAKSIHVEYELPYPPEKVWRALTDPELLSAWLMVNDIRPVVGHSFTFKAQPMPGWDGVVQCTVLEAEARKRLRYSWRGGSESARLDSVVTWTLTPTFSGTRLALEHSGFLPSNAFAYDAMSKGWRGKVAERMSEAIAKLASTARSVVLEREMPHPPEKVWRALTQGALIEEWLMKNDFRAVVGHRFTLRATPAPPHWNGEIDCEVLAVEPHTRLSYTWGTLGLESVVTWTLTPTEGGVVVRMEQSGFRPDQDNAYKGAKFGWQRFIDGLERVVGEQM
jgi:uncharacterized protein YndB with AHSA1/START domain